MQAIPSVGPVALHFQAQALLQQVATYPSEQAYPWYDLIQCVVRCASLAPAAADWQSHLVILGDLIAGGMVAPDADLLTDPHFVAQFAEYVHGVQQCLADSRSSILTDFMERLATAVQACETTRQQYEAGDTFLPYLHAVLTLRAVEWERVTAVAVAQSAPTMGVVA